MKTTRVHIKRSHIVDPVNPKDWQELNFTYACEQCSHYDEKGHQCTIGYDANVHRKAAQDRQYELMGKITLCRFLEID